VVQGYSVTAACAACGISRSTYYRQQQVDQGLAPQPLPREERLRQQIRERCGAHPFWGYRRVTAWLRYREDTWVNHKKVYRLMREEGLTVNRKQRGTVVKPVRPKPQAERPQQYWGIDMTKFLIPSIGWVYLVIVLDWYTKKIVGWDLALRSRAAEWKQVLEQAVTTEFPEGVRGNGLSLISDNGTQPTAIAFMKTTATLGINQIFTTYDNPKGNADTERMMRSRKHRR
jgi:putative transposase